MYQILPDNEVAADYIPFTASASYPLPLEVRFTSDEVRPGDPVDITVQTAGPAKVGLAAVDRSVFILAENRLNLQQVFAELELLYAQPQAEIHYERLPGRVDTRGAAETFTDAGLLMMTDQSAPAGVAFNRPRPKEPFFGPETGLLIIFAIIALLFVAGVIGIIVLIVFGIVQFARAVFTGLFAFVLVGMTGSLIACGGSIEEPAPTAYQEAAAPAAVAEPSSGLAEVERVRQFFPETWLWPTCSPTRPAAPP